MPDVSGGLITRDSKGPDLSRADIEKVIREGGSVFLFGRHIERVEQIPDGLEMAKDNPLLLEQEKDRMQKQIDDLQARLKEAQQDGDDMGASISSEGLDDTAVDEPLDYESLSRSALLVIAKDRGLPLQPKMSKDALLNLLKENHEARQAADGAAKAGETPKPADTAAKPETPA